MLLLRILVQIFYDMGGNIYNRSLFHPYPVMTYLFIFYYSLHYIMTLYVIGLHIGLMCNVYLCSTLWHKKKEKALFIVILFLYLL